MNTFTCRGDNTTYGNDEGLVNNSLKKDICFDDLVIWIPDESNNSELFAYLNTEHRGRKGDAMHTRAAKS